MITRLSLLWPAVSMENRSRQAQFVLKVAGAIAVSTFSAPVGAQMLVGDGSIACGVSYVVAVGDTLSKVSERAYGDPQLYGFIADANWDAIGGNTENIQVGMALTIPCVDASGKALTEVQLAENAKSIEAVVDVEGTLTPAQLDTLFGPVALFPDLVLTPVLVAATFPLDVVKAARFVDDSMELTDQERSNLAVGQDWDDSVRELAAGFPSVVSRMSDNIDWTEQAGEAVVAQTDDVLDSIQRLRMKAQENGYLIDNESQTVETVEGKVVISPADQNIVYVPTYDSQVVYTTPVTTVPYYGYGYDYYHDHDHDDWDEALIAGGIILGGAIILDEIFDDDDWDGWDDNENIDWDGGDITIDRDEINIDGGDRLDIGDGQIGGGNGLINDGGRVSIGDSDRTQISREAVGDRAHNGGRPTNDVGIVGDRASISNTASRDAARQKITTRERTGAKPATLQPSRSTSASRPTAGLPNRSAPVTRPSTNRAPSARTPSHSNAFKKPSGGGRPSASSNRGRSSMNKRGGGGGGRGGGRQ